MKQNSFSKRRQFSKMSGESRGGMSFTLMMWLCVAFMLIFFSMPAGAGAATLVYDGDGDKLQDLPDWALGEEGCFFPGTTDAPLASNNSVIVDYDPEDSENDNPNGVLGGLSQSAASFNTVEMRRGETEMIIGGYAMNMIDEGISVNASVSANGNSLGIGGGKAWAAAGGSAQISVMGREVDMLSVVLSAAAKDNTVNISGETEVGEVCGGLAGAGTEVGGSADVMATAVGNKANVNGGYVDHRVYGGAVYGGAYAYTEDSGAVDAKAKATASENEAAVSNSEIGDDVYGGYADANAEAVIENEDSSAAAKADATADASGNKVSVSGSEIRYEAIGGYADAAVDVYNDGSGAADAKAKATASNNEMTAYDSHIYYYLSGGEAYADANSSGNADAEATASGNTVTADNGSIVGHGVWGGYASAGAEGNGKINASATASGNTVTADNGSIAEHSVWGGYAGARAWGNGKINASATASGNAVTVSDSEINANAYGGRADAEAYGGDNADVAATASGNAVTVSDSEINEDVYGGDAEAYAGGMDAASAIAAALSNTVDISGSIIDSGVYGGYAEAIANSGGGNAAAAATSSGNKVKISDSTIDGYVYGGYAEAEAYENDGGATADATASGNIVTISGGSFVDGAVRGGFACIEAMGPMRRAQTAGLFASAGSRAIANDNIVNIFDSAAEIVYGGLSEATYGSPSSFLYAEASYNTVNIGGDSSIYGHVYGGYTWAEVFDAETEATAVASGNKVNISGGTIYSDIYGGYAYAYSESSTAAAFATDNTVSLSGELSLAESRIYGGYGEAYGTVVTSDFFTGNRLEVRSRNIAVFGVENFEFYDFYLPEGASAADTMLSVTGGVDMDASYANIYLQGETNLTVGDIVTLIESGGDVGKPLNDGEIVSARLGALLKHDFLVYVSDDDTNLYASYEGGGLSRGNGALGNSRLGAMAFLGQGADLSAWLEQLTTRGGVSGSKLTSFGGVLGGSSTYETGSDVEVKGWSLIAGVTKDVPVNGNSLRLSAFIEAGWGDYDTDNSYSGASVKGDGDMDYFGGGLHARYTWQNEEKAAAWYVDGSVRVGKINSDFSCRDLIDQFGRHLYYDVDSTYYGAHVGVGREWKLNEKTTIDVSSKFLWTRLEGDEFTTSTGDRVRFDDVDSYRWRTGFRVTSERTERVSIYGGLYYEYEFDGDAAGWLFGTYSLDKSSLSGGTGIGELGVTFKPSAGNDRLTMGVGAQGYVGTRKGVSGILKLQYEF